MQAQLSGRAPNSLVPAGEEVEVLVALRDAFGNSSDLLNGRHVDICAAGPELVSFSPSAPNRFKCAPDTTAAAACSCSETLPQDMYPKLRLYWLIWAVQWRLLTHTWIIACAP